MPEYLRRQCEQKQSFLLALLALLIQLESVFLFFYHPFFAPVAGHRMKQRLVSHEVSTFPQRQGWALGAL